VRSPFSFSCHPLIRQLLFRAKFQPYAELRQRFWAQYLKQYDTDDTRTFSHVELTSMLDSLGSTLSAQTIDTFFTRHRKRPTEDELTFEETIQCLETELGRPTSEKKRINTMDSFIDTSASPSASESVTPREELGWRPFLGGLDFSGPPLSTMLGDESPTDLMMQSHSQAHFFTEPNERPLVDVAEPLEVASTPGGGSTSSPSLFTSNNAQPSSTSTSTSTSTSGSSSEPDAQAFERVINIKNCPLCHRPRLNSKAEMDIITHLAICASQDWAKVDRIVVGNFVTASQAQRKWYTKVISKVSNGNYRIGAVSAFSFWFGG
jgi:phosphatidylserine decarboxylase